MNTPARAPLAAAGRSLSVGIVGIGAMGGAMARRLHACGWSPAVCDIDPAAVARAQRLGLRVHATPAALATDCELALIVVVDARQIETVLFGAEGIVHAKAGGGALHTVVLCSTIGPDDAADFARRLAAFGIHTVDAPISGGPLRAERGEMSMMVAAAAPVLARTEPLLRVLAGSLHLVGERIGDGARTKLVNNLLAGINLVAGAEAMALGTRLGLDPHALAALIQASSGASWIVGDRLPRALAGDLAPRARTTLLTKDLGLAVQMATAAGLPTPLGAVALRAFTAAVAAGHGDQDDAALFDHARGGPLTPG